MGDSIPVMASFGTENGLPSFSLCEVDRSDTLEAIVEKFSPTGWNDTNESGIDVKVSSTRSAANYDKFKFIRYYRERRKADAVLLLRRTQARKSCFPCYCGVLPFVRSLSEKG